jgi:MFS family permease
MPGTSPGLLAASHRALTIGSVLLIAQLAFESLAVTTAMPTVARALNGLSYYAVAFGATIAASMVGMALSGRWADLRGPRAPLMSGAFTFVAGLVIAGLAPDMTVLIVGRALQGLGTGQLIVALYVVVGRVYPAELRPRVFAAYAGAWVVPSLVGPSVAGLIVEHTSWRWVFLGVAVLMIPAICLVAPALRGLPPIAPAGAPDGRPGHRRLWWAGGAAISAALLHYAGQRRGLGALVLLLAAVAGIVYFAIRLLPAGALRLRPGLPSVIALRGLAAGSYVAAEVFVPLMLTTERSWSPIAAGLALSAGGVTWALGSWYQGRNPGGHSRLALLRSGMWLTAAGIAAVALVLWHAVPPLSAVIGWSMAGFGLGLVYPTLSVLTLETSTPETQGENSSSLQLCDSLVSTAGLAAGGSLFAELREHSLPAAYAACCGVALVLALTGAAAASRAARGSNGSAKT